MSLSNGKWFLRWDVIDREVVGVATDEFQGSILDRPQQVMRYYGFYVVVKGFVHAATLYCLL